MHAVTRASLPALSAGRRPAGHVIDCVGLTGDFRVRPLDTAEAHVGLVARCLAELQFNSFLLLSSTRVYARASATHEDAALPTVPADPSDLYNVTKLAGEALCLADQRPTIRVVRLSNVYGIHMPAETFLGQVLREGQATGGVMFQPERASAKDYVSVAAVVRLLPAIAACGQAPALQSCRRRQHQSRRHRRLPARHRRLADRLRPDAPTVRHLPIDTTRLDAEFGADRQRSVRRSANFAGT